MIAQLLSFLFPKTCFGCHRASTSLCERCLTLARKSLSTPHSYVISTFDFKDPLIRRAIHAIKYYRRRDLVHPLTEKLAEDVKKLPELHSYVLVPIPMPRIRKWIRGYNQAECIAKDLGSLLSLPVRTDILTRGKSPSRQVSTHTRQERLKNQAGTFLADNVAHMRIILVDDVCTTGATISSARNALLKAKAGAVIGVTLAH